MTTTEFASEAQVFQLSRDFVKPSRRLRTLAILEAIAGHERLNQSRIGHLAGMSGAMVNQYLKVMQADGLVTYTPIDAKSFKYSLTATGEATRRRYLGDYLAEVVRAYSGLKRMVTEKMAGLVDAGVTSMALWGASETGEVVLAALADAAISVTLVVDSDPARHGQILGTHTIHPPEALLDTQHGVQAVVITSFGKQDEIHQCATRLMADGGAQHMEITRL